MYPIIPVLTAKDAPMENMTHENGILLTSK